MNIRLYVVAISCTLFSFAANAQTSDAEAIINLLGVQKREAISKLVPVTGKDSVAFWNLYGQYEQDAKKNCAFKTGSV